jgi:hypothetical protein
MFTGLSLALGRGAVKKPASSRLPLGLSQFKQNLSVLSFQHSMLKSRFDMDVSGGILANWMPAIHAGTTRS